jgi:hypothetical protein
VSTCDYQLRKPGDRVGQYLDTVRTQGITIHWLRHTTLTWVERTYGYGVARAYAGHATASTNRFGVTATYIKGDLRDVATALAALTGEPHPLAIAPGVTYFDSEDPDHHDRMTRGGTSC